jgi:hypothetical protein
MESSPIQSAILIPSERPPRIEEVKLALLSFDRVHLPDPDDRDVIPRHALMAAMIGFPVFALDSGPVAPLGKVAGFDRHFAQLRDELHGPLVDGQVVIDPSIQTGAGQLTIGAVHIGAGVPNPGFVFHLYRALAARTDLLMASLEGTGLTKIPPDDLDALAPSSFVESGGVPEFGQLDAVPERPRKSLQRIAAVRVAAVTRFVATGDFRDLQPLTSDPGQRSVMKALLRAVAIARRGAAEDPDAQCLSLLARLHEVIVHSYIDEEKLSELSVKEVIGLRSKAWGKAQLARASLMSSLQALSEDQGQGAPGPEFEKSCQRAFDAYFRASADFWHEAKKLAASASLSTIGLVGAAVERGPINGVIHGLTGVSGAALLALAAIGITVAKELAPKGFDLYKDYRARKSSHGFALATPYGPFVRPRRQ